MYLPDDGEDANAGATPEYLAMLRRVTGRVPTHGVDWDAFHARLNDRAELPLARLRGIGARREGARQRVAQLSPSWLDYATMPSRRWRPIAAAAAIALVASVHALRSDISPLDSIDTIGLATSDVAGAQGAFESAVTGRTSSGNIASYLVPSAAEGTRSATSDSSPGK
jgi:hypothetical protein